jgi:hypothetical protein
MIPVDDPEILQKLEGGNKLSPVTDPALLKQLEGDKFGSSIPETLLNQYAQGVTLNAGDEITDTLATLAAKGIMEGQELFGGSQAPPLSELWQSARGNSQEAIQNQMQEHPFLSLLANVGGGVATGVGVANAASKSMPVLSSALAKFAQSNPLTASGGIGALQGGLGSFNAATGSATERLDDGLGGAVLGGMLGVPAGYIGSKIGRRLPSRIGLKKVEPVKQVAEQVAAPVNEIPDVAARSDLLGKFGIQPTRAMQTRDPKLWQFEQNTMGVQGEGDAIRQRYIDSNSRLQEAFDTMSDKIGGISATPYEAGSRAVEAVTKKSKEMQSQVGKLYGRIREEVGENLGMAPSKLTQTLDEVSDEASADPIVNSVKRKLIRYGVLDKDGNQRVTKTGGQYAISVKNAEELRKFIGNLSDGGDPSMQRIKSLLVDAVDDDVIDGAGVDHFKTARDAARERFKEFESSSLSGITKGKVVEDDVLKKVIFGSKIQDLSSVKKSLLSGTDAQLKRGTQAWDDLRSQAMKKILEDSTDASGKIQGSRLNKAMKGLGKERLEILFPDELPRLEEIRQAAEMTTIAPAESKVNYSNTGSALENLYRSRVGDTLVKAADVTGRLPLLNAPLSPLSGLARISGKSLQDAAVARNIEAALKGVKERKILSPSAPLYSGAAAGSTSSYTNRSK